MNTAYQEHSLKDNHWTTLARKFSIVAIWPVFLVAAPLFVHHVGWFVLPLVVPVGVYLVMWAGLLRHEVWHSNFSRVGRRRAFNLLSYLIFLDPHPYFLSHGPHHKHVHTTRDVLFFYLDDESDRKARKRAFILEFLLGNAVWEVATLRRLVRSGRVSRAAVIAAIPKRLFVGVSAATAVTLIGGAQALIAFAITTLLTFWAASLMARHVQWVEHLGVLVEGTMEARSMHTRNLTNETLFGKIFNGLTLQEAWNHTFHHVEPDRPLSSIDGLSPESNHVVIDGRQYWKILNDYYRSI